MFLFLFRFDSASVTYKQVVLDVERSGCVVISLHTSPKSNALRSTFL